MKYIIYLTINTVNNKIYIGVHKTETPYKFDGYLGNGVYLNDKYTYMHGKYALHAAIRKYGVDKFIRKTLLVFDTLEEALKMESIIVNQEFVLREDTYNETLGGGIPPMCCKQIYQYNLDGEFIQEWPSITEASIKYGCSSSSIGRAVLDFTPSMGYLWTEYKLDKLNLEDFKIDANKIPCYIFDTEYNLVQSFKSMTECAEFLGQELTNVSRACKTKQLVGKKYYISIHKVFDKPSSNCPIYQYDLDGNFIRKWENQSQARKELGISTSITNSINAQQTCGGYQWTREYFKSIPPKKKRARKVGRYSLEGELLEVYDSVRKAKEAYSGSLNALRGKQKTSNGYIWKYID